jgi:hypothetical protein
MFTKPELPDDSFDLDPPCLKLIDFGLARRLGADRGLLKDMSATLGTRGFQAPEQRSSSVIMAFVDRVDLWALGVILHIVFTGDMPYFDDNPKPLKSMANAPAGWTNAPAETKPSTAAGLSNITTFGRDLLEQLLSVEPIWRLTAIKAMQHPWYATACRIRDSSFLQSICTVKGFSMLAKRYAASSKLRRLSLAAVTYTTDDHDASFVPVRQLFQALEYVCDGSITSFKIKEFIKDPEGRGAGSTLLNIAIELHPHFETINVTGSRMITWIEFVALFVQASDARGSKRHGSDFFAPIISISEDVCRQAFDLLSDGTKLISGRTIGEIFTPVANDRVLNFETGTKPAKLWAGGFCNESDCNRLIREVSPNGVVDFTSFMRMLSKGGEPSPGREDRRSPRKGGSPASMELGDHRGLAAAVVVPPPSGNTLDL